jgi:hypothetical protein
VLLRHHYFLVTISLARSLIRLFRQSSLRSRCLRRHQLSQSRHPAMYSVRIMLGFCPLSLLIYAVSSSRSLALLGLFLVRGRIFCKSISYLGPPLWSLAGKHASKSAPIEECCTFTWKTTAARLRKCSYSSASRRSGLLFLCIAFPPLPNNSGKSCTWVRIDLFVSPGL